MPLRAYTFLSKTYQSQPLCQSIAAGSLRDQHENPHDPRIGNDMAYHQHHREPPTSAREWALTTPQHTSGFRTTDKRPSSSPTDTRRIPRQDAASRNASLRVHGAVSRQENRSCPNPGYRGTYVGRAPISARLRQQQQPNMMGFHGLMIATTTARTTLSSRRESRTDERRASASRVPRRVVTGAGDPRVHGRDETGAWRDRGSFWEGSRT